MPITIINPELEKRLVKLGQRQLVPVAKTTMAEAILCAAVSDDRGGPVDKWHGEVRLFVSKLNESSQQNTQLSDSQQRLRQAT